MPRHLKPTQAQRERFGRQLEFIREHRDRVPKFIPVVSQRYHIAASTLYNTINGFAFNTLAIEAMYTYICEALGFDKLIGERVDDRGRNVANEYDQTILEDFARAQEEEQIARNAALSHALALRAYEQAYVRLMLSRTAIRKRYQLTGARLSPETLTIISEYLATDDPSANTPNTLIPIEFRPQAEIEREIHASNAASSGQPLSEEGEIVTRAEDSPFARIKPETEYELLPVAKPEAGNTDEDYRAFLAEQERKKLEPKPTRRPMLTAAEIEARLVEARAAVEKRGA